MQDSQNVPSPAGLEWEELFQAIGHPAFILNPEHEILAINRAAATLGKETREILGKKCFDLFHVERKPPEYCPMEKMKATRKFEQVEAVEELS